MSILYITQDGITDHIGRSQVAPYVLGLARRGHRIHVLSAEKEGREDLIAEYGAQFAAAGVEWTRVRYRNRPQLLGQLWTQMKLRRVAGRIVRKNGVRLVHCRSFPPALIGQALKRRGSVRYVFDFRDFYADGGMQTKRFKLVYRWLKRKEGGLVRDADKVVCLTQRAAGILSRWYLADRADALRHFQVIPCCADFSLFDPAQVSDAQRAAARRRADIPDGVFVLLYLGSLGPDYLLPEMVSLFRALLEVRPESIFLFVANNGHALVEREFTRQGVDIERFRLVNADRREVPHYVALADSAVIFIRSIESKAGCSPTKLAELFACNVPVIANAGVGDLDRIISPETNASMLVPDFSVESLRRASKFITAPARRNIDIRSKSRDYSLESGVDRYDAVYRELIGPPRPPQEAETC